MPASIPRALQQLFTATSFATTTGAVASAPFIATQDTLMVYLRADSVTATPTFAIDFQVSPDGGVTWLNAAIGSYAPTTAGNSSVAVSGVFGLVSRILITPSGAGASAVMDVFVA